MQKHLPKVLAALSLAVPALWPAQADAKFTFLYNHPDLDWYSIETEHFVVHYPESRKPADKGNDHWLTAKTSAALSARSAEEFWAKSCAEYNYFLKEKVHIVLLNQTDDLEGFTVPPWDWIEISANPGSYFYRTRGRAEWFSDVLVHEFGHVVSLKANAIHSEGTQGVELGGLYQDGIHNVGAGANMFILDGEPFLFTEGSSEGSSDFDSYNWWTSARDLTIRSSILQGRFLEFEQVGALLRPYGWMDGERAYQQGYSFNLYLRGRFGEDVYAKLAVEAGRHWRFDWWTVIEDVTGVDARTLYSDYKQYLEDTYSAQQEAIRAEGEVVGRELLPGKPDWDFTAPSEREDWQKRWSKRHTKYKAYKEREKTGTWVMEPRYDARTGMFGLHTYGTVMVTKADPDREVGVTGSYPRDPTRLEEQARLTVAVPAGFMYGWDFVPGKDQIVITGNEHYKRNPVGYFLGTNADFDGYNWNEIWTVDLRTRTEKKKGVEFETLALKKTLKKDFFGKDAIKPVPGTERGSDPAVSPDGNRIVFLQYTDGTVNLATVNLDGSDKRMLTNYDDGTWLQRPRWSPDGKKIVFAMFRNYMQELYTINADGTGLEALTWSPWEEEDAWWTADNKIYFAADPTGVYNIFSYDLATRKVLQVTNVVNGAMCPMITPEGNLIYIYYDAFGYKTYGLARSDFLNKDVTDLFHTRPNPDVVQRAAAFSEDLTPFTDRAKPYKWHKALMPPSGYPMFRFENQSMNTVDPTVGFVMWVQDYVEKHGMAVQAFLGEDNLLFFQYFNQMTYLNLMATVYHYEGKYPYAYWIDFDEREETTSDQWIFEGKNNYYQNAGYLTAEYPWSSTFNTYLWVNPWEYGFRDTDNTGFVPYMREVEGGFTGSFSNNSFDYRSPNPRKGRNVELSLSRGYTDIVYEAYGGVGIDDYMELDKYTYDKAELRWTEQMNLPTLGGLGFLESAKAHDHRIQFDTRLGFIDRNVDMNDEFVAGGQHPYDWGVGSLRPNTLFAGYPYYSLRGETMGIANLAYRFPVRRYIMKKYGPLMLGSVYAQVGGTAGNLWSFRPPEEDADIHFSKYDERVANDPSTIEREIPFIDTAYKNGNYMLYDAEVELRVNAILFNGAYWDSFFRVAYGFQEVRGYGDVNGDDIYDTSDNARGDELSNETEPAGFRFYLGLGTGW